jgi:peroxiredoxin
MSLKETLDALRAEMSEEGFAAFNEVLRKFDTQALREHALRHGDRMPDFILPNAEGKLILSEELRQRSPLIISFYRGSWCPYCARLLQAVDAMVRVLPDGRDIALLALSPEIGGRAASFKKMYDLQCEVLIDVDNAMAALFGVLVHLPTRYRRALLRNGVSVDALHGQEGWFIPLASTFVISKSGTVVHAEIHVDHTRRTELDSLPGVIEALWLERQE